ncbi:PAS domain S-box protein [Candidatus Sumerlaeota bacterium]|nr:PAS domain S-box protein [Candidatus Sumerlaeota bacterium]
MTEQQAPVRPGIAALAKVDARAMCTLLGAASDVGLVGFAADGKILLFNKGAERLFGYRADTVIGAATYEVLHKKDDFSFFFEENAFAENPVREMETHVITRTGDLLPARLTIHKSAPAAEDGIVYYAFYRNISELAGALRQAVDLRNQINETASQTQKEAQFLRQLLRHTVEAIQIGIAVQNFDDGVLAYVNEGFEQITGLGNPDVMGRTIAEVFSQFPETCNRINDFTERIRKSATGEGTTPSNALWELDFPAGKRSVEMYGRSTIVEGHPSQYVLLLLEDVTERQRLQMQLVQSEKLAAIGQLAAGIAHEMRNPLNTIYNALFDLTEILKNPAPDVAEDINISMEEIKRVHEIINNMLDFARESGRTTGRANLNEVITRTIRLVQHDLSNKHIAITADLKDIPPVAISNNAMKQILINMTTNAADAMPKGGSLSISTMLRRGKVPLHNPPSCAPQETLKASSIRLAEISGHPTRDFSEGVYAEHALIKFSDTGHGIPSALLPNVFNPFFTTKPPGSGTGLGLSIVHSLVQDAGGAISVKSQEGVGTTFVIELPVLADDVEG